MHFQEIGSGFDYKTTRRVAWRSVTIRFHYLFPQYTASEYALLGKIE